MTSKTKAATVAMAAAVAAAMGQPVGADMRHLDTPARRIERKNRGRKWQRSDPRDPKRRKTTRAWRKKMRPTQNQRRRERAAFIEAFKANPSNRLTGWQLHQWQRACIQPDGSFKRVDPAPFLTLERRT